MPPSAWGATVSFWPRATEELRQAVSRVGDRAEAVERHLKGGKGAED